jgi:hypothetical protein
MVVDERLMRDDPVLGAEVARLESTASAQAALLDGDLDGSRLGLVLRVQAGLMLWPARDVLLFTAQCDGALGAREGSAGGSGCPVLLAEASGWARWDRCVRPGRAGMLCFAQRGFGVRRVFDVSDTLGSALHVEELPATRSRLGEFPESWVSHASQEFGKDGGLAAVVAGDDGSGDDLSRLVPLVNMVILGLRHGVGLSDGSVDVDGGDDGASGAVLACASVLVCLAAGIPPATVQGVRFPDGSAVRVLEHARRLALMAMQALRVRPPSGLLGRRVCDEDTPSSASSPVAGVARPVAGVVR